MQNWAYRFGRNSGRDRNNRGSDRYNWRSPSRNNCCPEGDRESNHNRNRNKRHAHNNSFNPRGRNLYCTQPLRRGGCA